MEEKKIVTVYLVRHYFRTTDQHPDGPDLWGVYLSGKGGHSIGQYGTYVEAQSWEKPHDPAPYELAWYGYKRAGDAKRAAEKARAWHAKDPYPCPGFTGDMYTVVAWNYYD